MSEPTPLATVQAIYDAAFDATKEPHSEPFKRGALSCLRGRILGDVRLIGGPHAPGTTEHDAFWAGVSYGHELFMTHRIALGQRAFDDVMTAVDAQPFELPKAAR